MFAGHGKSVRSALEARWTPTFVKSETTAMVLAETITLLALYQDEQEKAYQEIISVPNNNSDPVSSFRRVKHRGKEGHLNSQLLIELGGTREVEICPSLLYRSKQTIS
jgi:hypothetical protein